VISAPEQRRVLDVIPGRRLTEPQWIHKVSTVDSRQSVKSMWPTGGSLTVVHLTNSMRTQAPPRSNTQSISNRERCQPLNYRSLIEDLRLSQVSELTDLSLLACEPLTLHVEQNELVLASVLLAGRGKR